MEKSYPTLEKYQLSKSKMIEPEDLVVLESELVCVISDKIKCLANLENYLSETDPSGASSIDDCFEDLDHSVDLNVAVHEPKTASNDSVHGHRTESHDFDDQFDETCDVIVSSCGKKFLSSSIGQSDPLASSLPRHLSLGHATMNDSLVESLQRNYVYLPFNNDFLDKLWPHAYRSFLNTRRRKNPPGLGRTGSLNSRQSIDDALKLESIRSRLIQDTSLKSSSMLELDANLKQSLREFQKSKFVMEIRPTASATDTSSSQPAIIKAKSHPGNDELIDLVQMLQGDCSTRNELVWADAERLDTERTLAELSILEQRMIQHVYDTDLKSTEVDFDKLAESRERRLQSLKNTRPFDCFFQPF